MISDSSFPKHTYMNMAFTLINKNKIETRKLHLKERISGENLLSIFRKKAGGFGRCTSGSGGGATQV